MSKVVTNLIDEALTSLNTMEVTGQWFNMPDVRLKLTKASVISAKEDEVFSVDSFRRQYHIDVKESV